MSFFKRIFGGKAPEKAEPVVPTAHGIAPLQSQEEVDATRQRMESEMAKQQERRKATDTPS